MTVIEICKLSQIETPNQICIECKVLNVHTFATLEHFRQTKKYNGIGLLLQTALEKVGNEKHGSTTIKLYNS